MPSSTADSISQYGLRTLSINQSILKTLSINQDLSSVYYAPFQRQSKFWTKIFEKNILLYIQKLNPDYLPYYSSSSSADMITSSILLDYKLLENSFCYISEFPLSRHIVLHNKCLGWNYLKWLKEKCHKDWRRALLYSTKTI